jgi:hypothetical protein
MTIVVFACAYEAELEFAEFETGLGNEYDIYLLIGPILSFIRF